MLVDNQRKRILLEDGSSVVSVDSFALSIIKNKPLDGLKVVEGFDASAYREVYGIDISIDDTNLPLCKSPNHENTEEGIEDLLTRLQKSDRYKEDEEYLDRLSKELEFFIQTSNVSFLLGVTNLVDKFRERGIVWGVGRGSACASLVLYMLHVHDIDPILYDINFSELSKDSEFD